MLTSTSVVQWVGGVSAAALLGYALYFDYRRTHAPDYKNIIRQKRQEKKRAKHEQEIANLPDIRNTAEVQQYFLQQIQLGEELVQQGIVDEGVKHLCNAIILCGQPEHLLTVFQQTMPDEYPKIVEELPRAQVRIDNELKIKFGAQMRGLSATGTIVDEDDFD